jgi:hypothetical protein
MFISVVSTAITGSLALEIPLMPAPTAIASASESTNSSSRSTRSVPSVRQKCPPVSDHERRIALNGPARSNTIAG